jgi:hypothetical protein
MAGESPGEIGGEVTEQTYRWHGQHGPGAMRAYREQKRITAELRNEEYRARVAESARKDPKPATRTPATPKARKGGKGAKKRRRELRLTPKVWSPSDGEAPNQDQMGL